MCCLNLYLLITVFPTDSGLPPIYVMFRDPREDAGVATVMCQPVTGIWLGEMMLWAKDPHLKFIMSKKSPKTGVFMILKI